MRLFPVVVKGDRIEKFQTWWPGPEGIKSSLQMTSASPTVVLLGGLPTVAMSPYVTGKGLQQPDLAPPNQANPKVPKLSTSIKCFDLVKLLPEES